MAKYQIITYDLLDGYDEKIVLIHLKKQKSILMVILTGNLYIL